jgi:hypothetical protein
MVIKVTNNPGIKDVTWNIDKVKNFIPIKVLNSVGIKFSSESNYVVLPPKRLKITEFALQGKIDNTIKEDMVFMPWSEFFLEVQYTLEEPADTVVDIFLNALNTKFTETDMLIIATHNLCSLLRKTYERMCNMPKNEASMYFRTINNLPYVKQYLLNLTGKVGNWLYAAFDYALYLRDPECHKQYKKFINGE